MSLSSKLPQKKERKSVPFFVAFSVEFSRDPVAALLRQVGAGRTKERSQCEMKRLSEGAAVEGFKTELRVAEASGTANGAALAYHLRQTSSGSYLKIQLSQQGMPRKKALLSTKTREVFCFLAQFMVLWYDEFGE